MADFIYSDLNILYSANVVVKIRMHSYVDNLLISTLVINTKQFF